ncbi:MAG: histone deacetylase [Dehalococcoidia bacterium]|nr:MAG: histone deacetylase [Dehalococcoidia bacterium]
MTVRLPTLFLTDTTSDAHVSEGHPERPARLHAILDHLSATGLRARMIDVAPREATDTELLRVHSASHLARVAATSARSGWFDADTYTTTASEGVARRAAGAVVQAVEAALAGTAQNAFVAVRPPGHHAEPEIAMGFCLYNSVAVGAAAALAAGLERVAILDWDVHHGNGTQAIFEADPHVFYASTHEYPYYPGTGHFSETGIGEARGTTLNVPLPRGAGDIAITRAYREVILPALACFSPDLILVSSGWDAHRRDPLAGLEVSTAGYTQVAREAIEAAERLCNGRIVVALEGGYDEHALAWCAGSLASLLLGEEPAPDPEPGYAGTEPDITLVLDAVRRAIGPEGA